MGVLTVRSTTWYESWARIRSKAGIISFIASNRRSRRPASITEGSWCYPYPLVRGACLDLLTFGA